MLLPGISFGLANRTSSKQLAAEFSQSAQLPPWAARLRRANLAGELPLNGHGRATVNTVLPLRQQADGATEVRGVRGHPKHKTAWRSPDAPDRKAPPTMQRWLSLCDNGADIQMCKRGAAGARTDSCWAAVSGVRLALRARRQRVAAAALIGGGGEFYALGLTLKRLALAKLLLSPPSGAAVVARTKKPRTHAQQMAEQEIALKMLQGEARELRRRLVAGEGRRCRLCGALAVWGAVDTLLRRSLARFEIHTRWDTELAELGRQRGETGQRALVQAMRRHNCLLGRARCWEILGQTAAALSDTEDALAAYPNSPSGLRLLGRLLALAGRQAEAETAGRRAEKFGTRIFHTSGENVSMVVGSTAQGRAEDNPPEAVLEALTMAEAAAEGVDESLSEVACERGREWATGHLHLDWDVAIGLVAERHQSCGLPLLPPTLMQSGEKDQQHWNRLRHAVGVTLSAAAEDDDEQEQLQHQQQTGRGSVSQVSRQLIAQWRSGGILRYWSAWCTLTTGCCAWRHQETLALPAFRLALADATTTNTSTSTTGVLDDGGLKPLSLSALANTQARHAKLVEAARAAKASAAMAATAARDPGTCERQSAAAMDYERRAAEVEGRAIAAYARAMRFVLGQQLLAQQVAAVDAQETQLADIRRSLARVRCSAERIAFGRPANQSIADVKGGTEEQENVEAAAAVRSTGVSEMGASFWAVMKRSMHHRFAATADTDDTDGAAERESVVAAAAGASDDNNPCQEWQLQRQQTRQPLISLELELELVREIASRVDTAWRHCIRRLIVGSGADSSARSVSSSLVPPLSVGAEDCEWERLAWAERPFFIVSIMTAPTEHATGNEGDWEARWAERVLSIETFVTITAADHGGRDSTSSGSWPLPLGLSRQVLSWLDPPDVLIGCAGTCQALRRAVGVDDPTSMRSSSSSPELWVLMRCRHQSIAASASTCDGGVLGTPPPMALIHEGAGKARVSSLLVQTRLALQSEACDVVTAALETRPGPLLQLVAAAAWQLHLLLRCRNDLSTAELEAAQVRGLAPLMRWRVHREGGLRALVTQRILEPACPEGAALFRKRPCDSVAAIEATIARLLPYVAAIMTYADNTDGVGCDSGVLHASSSLLRGEDCNSQSVARALVPFILAADAQLRCWVGQAAATDEAAVRTQGKASRVVAFCRMEVTEEN